MSRSVITESSLSIREVLTDKSSGGKSLVGEKFSELFTARESGILACV
jgi:hypothetical protein